MTSSDRQLAIVYATIAQMNCEVAGMIAENMQRSHAGHSMAYTEDDFANLIEKYEPVIGYNAIASISMD